MIIIPSNGSCRTQPMTSELADKIKQCVREGGDTSRFDECGYAIIVAYNANGDAVVKAHANSHGEIDTFLGVRRKMPKYERGYRQ